jgi:hypothetical protein
MRTRRAVLAALLALAATVGGCSLPIGAPYRVKITLEAEVMGQPRRVEQVYEIRHAVCSSSFCNRRVLSGDAIVFETADNGILLVQLEGNKIADLLFAILLAKREGDRYPRDISPQNADEVKLVHDARTSDVYAFDPSRVFWNWVHFTDRANPSSGRYFDMSTGSERRVVPLLRLKSATVQKTTEPVTRKISRLLPWIDRYTQNATLEVPPHDLIASSASEHPLHLVRGHFTSTRD